MAKLNTAQVEQDDEIQTAENFEIEMPNILERIVEQVEIRMSKEKVSKEKIFESYPYKIPISRKTWYDYKEKKKKDLKIGTLYDICNYTNVSADYYLGYNKSVRKEASSLQIKEDYGLTDDALEKLARMHKRTEDGAFQYNKLSDVDFINMLIAEFAPNFFSYILCYFTAVDEYEEFKAKYLNKKGKIKKQYLDRESYYIEQYQELTDKVDSEKFKLVQNVFRFVDSLKKADSSNS